MLLFKSARGLFAKDSGLTEDCHAGLDPASRYRTFNYWDFFCPREPL